MSASPATARAASRNTVQAHWHTARSNASIRTMGKTSKSPICTLIHASKMAVAYAGEACACSTSQPASASASATAPIVDPRVQVDDSPESNRESNGRVPK